MGVIPEPATAVCICRPDSPAERSDLMAMWSKLLQQCEGVGFARSPEKLQAQALNPSHRISLLNFGPAFGHRVER